MKLSTHPYYVTYPRSQALPPPRAQLLRLTFDPLAQKSEGEPGSKHHLNDVVGRRYLIGVGSERKSAICFATMIAKRLASWSGVPTACNTLEQLYHPEQSVFHRLKTQDKAQCAGRRPLRAQITRSLLPVYRSLFRTEEICVAGKWPHSHTALAKA